MKSKNFCYGTLYMANLVILAIFLAGPSHAQFWSKKHPREEVIVAWLEENLPDIVTIDHISIYSQELKQDLAEYSETQLTVLAKPTEPLYATEFVLEDGTRVLKERVPSGPNGMLQLSGIVEAAKTGGKWEKVVRWDGGAASQIRRLGQPRSRFPETEVILNSEAYHQTVARIEEEKQAAVAKEQARLAAEKTAQQARASAVSGSFEGVAQCGGVAFTIDELAIDAVAGTGRYQFTHIGSGGSTGYDKQTDHTLSIRETNDAGIFRARVQGTNQWIIVGIPSGRLPNITIQGCEVSLYPKGMLPDNVKVYREVVRNVLDTFDAGLIKAELAEKGKKRQVAVEVVKVEGNRLTLRIDQPRLSSGRFNRSEKNRSLVEATVIFNDPPLGLVTMNDVNGGGDSVLRGSCKPVVSFEDEKVIFSMTSGYGCNETLVLEP